MKEYLQIAPPEVAETGAQKKKKKNQDMERDASMNFKKKKKTDRLKIEIRGTRKM